MPSFIAITAADVPDTRKRVRKERIDRLAAYVDAIRDAEAVRVELEPGDNARGVAIRLQLAAKRLGRRVKSRNIGGAIYSSFVG